MRRGPLFSFIDKETEELLCRNRDPKRNRGAEEPRVGKVSG